MKTPGSVLLLLLLWSGLVGVAAESGGLQDVATGADKTSTQQTCQPDIHTVLREMMVWMMAEQRVDLKNTKTQMEAMETRLRASENKAETMETRLRASEEMVEEQRAVIKELKEKQEEQAAAVRAVGDSVNLTGSQVEELRKEREERRVSFSASLVASGDRTLGPFSTATSLVYKHVFTNIGNAYNPHTGVFTAPVRGVYYFDVFVFGNGHASRPTAVSLHKNTEPVVIAYSAGQIHHVAVSNGVSLLLEVGDVVHLKLLPNAWVRDTTDHHTTFSGHLLFTM